MLNHLKSQWANLPRRRRKLSKQLLNWHQLTDGLTVMMAKVFPDQGMQQDATYQSIALATQVPLLLRLESIREVVFSGFQLDLYTMEERGFAYWYCAEVLQQHITILGRIIEAVPGGKRSPHFPAHRSLMILGTKTWEEHNFQHSFLVGLRSICLALFPVSICGCNVIYINHT